jgi:uncharacterized protein YuzE
MQIDHDPGAQRLLITLNRGPVVRRDPVASGVTLAYAADGRVVAIELAGDAARIDEPQTVTITTRSSSTTIAG